MTSTLFNRAYVRGLNAELVRTGAIQYPTKEAADHAADYVADVRSGSFPSEAESFAAEPDAEGPVALYASGAAGR